MDTYDALAAAVASTDEIVGRIDPSHYTRPTPCPGWDVRALLNHALGTLWNAEATFADYEPRHPREPGGLPADDLAGTDPSAAYAEAAKAALTAAAIEGTLERTHQSPLGELPGAVLIGLPTADVFVHGWDLARATGQQAEFDEELATHVLDFVRQVLTHNRPPPPIFGAEVAVVGSAPVMDRLVGFLGRTP